MYHLIPRGLFAFMTIYLATTTMMINPVCSFRAIRPQTTSSATFMRRYQSACTVVAMAAPGVEMASPQEIQKALQQRLSSTCTTTPVIIDARSVGELEQHRYYDPSSAGARWIHAKAKGKMEAPLLHVAASALIPEKDTPVMVYSGSGIRATACKDELEKQGYPHVLNAGGLADLRMVMEENE